ncbi:MAG: glycosyltransferase [Lautropia sp.]
MILLYHKVYPEAKTVWWVDVERFHRDLVALRSRKVVYLDDYDPADPDHAVITFDGIYRNVLEFAAPLLRDFGYPFELFFSGDHVGHSNAFDVVEPPADFVDREGLARLVELGGRLQWHSASHADLREVSDDALARELAVPAAYAALDPSGFGWLAYPHGEFDARVLDATRGRFRGAVSCNQGDEEDRFKLNRTTITNDSPALARPSVAVIVASYNYGRFLVEAVDSVLAQSQQPDEIHLVDDCSDDDTASIAAALSSAHPGRLQVHRNERNLGIEANFNAAVSRTRADYVCILGADNRLPANYVESLAGILDRHPEVAIAYSDFALFGPRARLVYGHYPAQRQGRIIHDQYFVVGFPEFTPESAATLREHNFIHGSSMYRRTAFDQVGGYASRQNGAEDHQLFRAMIEAGWLARRSPSTMLEYRQHSREQANERLNQGIALRFFQDRTRQLQGDLDAREREVAPLRARLDEAVRELDRTRSELAATQASSRHALDEAHATIGAMRASSSWRITAPMRMIGHLAAGRLGLVATVIRNKLRG